MSLIILDGFSSLVFNWFQSRCQHQCHLRSKTCHFCFLMLLGRAQASGLSFILTILLKEVVGYIRWDVLGVILLLSSVAPCVTPWMQRRACLSCFFCLLCILISTLTPLVSGLSVLLSPGSLFYFFIYFLSKPPSSSSFSQIPYLTFCFWVVVFLSFSPSFFCAFSASRLLLGSFWCPHGWLNDWSHKAVPPTLAHTAKSCSVLRCCFSCCCFSCSVCVKKKAECDSDAKVGGICPGGWLNRLTEASPTHFYTGDIPISS